MVQITGIYNEYFTLGDQHAPTTLHEKSVIKINHKKSIKIQKIKKKLTHKKSNITQA